MVVVFYVGVAAFVLHTLSLSSRGWRLIGATLPKCAGVSYALDRSLNLAGPTWFRIATNIADLGGIVFFTNAPTPGGSTFWRISAVP